MNGSAHFLFPVIVAIIMTSCNKTTKSNDVRSGTIEYHITYLNEDIDERQEALLPENMVLVFNENLAVNSIDGFLGLYKFHTITNFASKKCSTLLKVFDRHYLYNGKRGEFVCCFDEMEELDIRETDETRNIAGLTCKRAIVTHSSGRDTYDIYYTTDINLPHPNMNNPYKGIDGVLMQFELQLLHLRMEFTAIRFQPNSGKGSKPAIPEEITEVSRDQMIQILNKLIE
ncbi:MAG: hypothetical protein JXA61_00615 [Bacteroidales bacterium]|nr:hypothetical protein [Bacteroidales bacterium]